MDKNAARHTLGALSVTLSLFCALCSSAPVDFDETSWRESIESTATDLLYAPHFTAGKYSTPWAKMPDFSFSTVIRWKIFTKPGMTYTKEDESYLPAVIPDVLGRIKKLEGKDFILWIGHNSFAVRIGDTLYITDPIFSSRAVIVKRVTPPALSAKDIAAIAPKMTVIITHNHHDHLDSDSIEDLPASATYVVPMGLKGFMEGLGKKDVVEMDWWQEKELADGVTIACLPAQHWSKRITQGTNKTLWASYLLKAGGLRIYFAGDSGYFAGYKEIGKKYHPIDYAFMPITAFMPRWFMHYAHMDVDEALRAFHETGAGHFIPTQWGTFHLGEEPPGYGALLLKKRIAELGLDFKKFHLLDIGGIEVIR